MAPHDLDIEQADHHIAVVRLNRPDNLNALRSATLEELASVLEETQRNDTRVVVVTGVGKAFSAGADLNEIERLRSTGTVAEDPRHRHWTRIKDRTVPMIAAVNGLALGGGCELAMQADIAIAAASARFGQPETRIGLIPGAGATQRLTRAVGKSMAMKMILTGKSIGAEEALSCGLVAEVVPDGQILERALELAAAVATNPQRAVEAARQAVEQAFEVSLAGGLAFERARFQELFATEDLKEGLAAFAEKRPPRFG